MPWAKRCLPPYLHLDLPSLGGFKASPLGQDTSSYPEPLYLPVSLQLQLARVAEMSRLGWFEAFSHCCRCCEELLEPMEQHGCQQQVTS